MVVLVMVGWTVGRPGNWSIGGGVRMNPAGGSLLDSAGSVTSILCLSKGNLPRHLLHPF